MIQDIFAKMEQMEVEKHDRMEREKLELAKEKLDRHSNLKKRNLISLSKHLFRTYALLVEVGKQRNKTNESEVNIASDGPEKTTALKIRPTAKNNGDRFHAIDENVYPPFKVLIV